MERVCHVNEEMLIRIFLDSYVEQTEFDCESEFMQKLNFLQRKARDVQRESIK